MTLPNITRYTLEEEAFWRNHMWETAIMLWHVELPEDMDCCPVTIYSHYSTDPDYQGIVYEVSCDGNDEAFESFDTALEHVQGWIDDWRDEQNTTITKDILAGNLYRTWIDWRSHERSKVLDRRASGATPLIFDELIISGQIAKDGANAFVITLGDTTFRITVTKES